MAKKMLIDATHAEETRVVVVEGNKVEEFDFESITKRPLAGNIYLAKITRVEPSLQAAFVDYGGNRHGFLAFSEIHPDYYQIPVEDRQKLLDEEAAMAREDADEDDNPAPEVEAEDTDDEPQSDAAQANSEGSGSSDDAVVSAPVSDDGPLLVDTPESGGNKSRRQNNRGGKRPRRRGGQSNRGRGGKSVKLSPEQETAAIAAAVSEAEAYALAVAKGEIQPKPVRERGDRGGRSRGRSRRSDTTKSEARQDGDIESVGAEDVQEEIRPRRQRMRRYNIQEVIKVRQIMLVQVVKEERGNKGAALTTYLSLAGRYCVLMPNTARGGGISRKITNPADRKKLKEIASEIEIPQGAGLIVRTAGSQRTKTEIKRDYEYLLRQWEQIRDQTLSSIAPALIYEEGDLIKRSIRDLYNKEIDEILVEGEAGFKEAKEYMKMLLPTHAKNVRHYNEPLPLYSRYQVETYLAGMLNPTVQLRSGGYIVIGITEALVAVDVNSGRATKEGSIEDTAVKTNLEAAEEVARQMRLRDLAGLLVIDFIDMEERRNNAAVEKRLKDSLKSDRARIQVGRISGFGLLEMSRQRLRPGMLESTTTHCPHCHGTGYVRSNESLALAILRELEEEGTRARTKEVLVKVPLDIANYMLNQKREHVAMIEGRFGMSVRIEADMHLISPNYTVERFKTATRIIAPMVAGTSVSYDAEDAVEEIAEDAEAETEAEVVANTAAPESPETTNEDDPRKKPRRRRRKRGGKSGDDAGADEDAGTDGNAEAGSEEQKVAAEPDVPDAKPKENIDEKPKRKSRSRSRKKPVEEQADVAEVEAPPEAPPEAAPDEPVKEKPKRKSRARKKADPVAENVEESVTPEPALETASTVPEADAPAKSDKPRRKGWWSRATGR